MTREEFESAVAEAVRGLPVGFRRKLENISVHVADRPTARMLREAGVPPGRTLLGLYQGVPYTKRGVHYGNVLPDRVILFQGTIEAACPDPSQLPQRIRDVLVHEMGHYFGLSDEEMSSG